jgi:hypothetical protein
MTLIFVVLVSALIALLMVGVIVICALIAAGRAKRGGYTGNATSQTSSPSPAEGQSAK